MNRLFELVWEDNKNNYFDLFMSGNPYKLEMVDNLKKKNNFDPRECSWHKFSKFLEASINSD